MITHYDSQYACLIINASFGRLEKQLHSTDDAVLNQSQQAYWQFIAAFFADIVLPNRLCYFLSLFI